MELTSKGVYCLVGSASPTVGADTRAALGVDMVFFLEFMSA